MLEDEAEKAASFLDKALQQLGGLNAASHPAVLDFGCGQGYLVKALKNRQYDMSGCDVQEYWMGKQLPHTDRLRVIPLSPYRLPFDDNTFDAVISTSVMEHVMNKEAVFGEIYRVLKPGGHAIHQFPGKWYLPTEPHMKVPLVSQLWPFCPRWWFYFWARLGVRNEAQVGQEWQSVAKENYDFYSKHLSYWSNQRYERLSLKIFKNYSAPMTFYIDHAYGGFAKVARKLPGKRFWGWVSTQSRVNLILLRKSI